MLKERQSNFELWKVIEVRLCRYNKSNLKLYHSQGLKGFVFWKSYQNILFRHNLLQLILVCKLGVRYCVIKKTKTIE